MPSKPSVFLLGSKPGSVAALWILLRRGWDVKAVVVSPKIRRPWEGSPDLGEYARSRGVPVVTAQKRLADLGPVDYVISYMFRYRVKAATLALAGKAALNFHAGPLPEFGGWAFYNVAILENAPEYGCTCHHMDEGFDTGPLVKVRRFPILAREETAVSLEKRSQEEMIRLFGEFCEMAESGEPLPREVQDPERMRYLSHEQFEALKEIPPGADEETADRHARAFWYPPYPCAYMKVGPLRVEVVPRIARESLAPLVHGEDLSHLMRVAEESHGGAGRGDR